MARKSCCRNFEKPRANSGLLQKRLMPRKEMGCYAPLRSNNFRLQHLLHMLQKLNCREAIVNHQKFFLFLCGGQAVNQNSYEFFHGKLRYMFRARLSQDDQ